MANAPLWDRTAGVVKVIWVSREWKYFCKWDWTRDQRTTVICPSGKPLDAVRPDIAGLRTWALNDDRIIDVRFAAHYGLSSEFAPCPFCAIAVIAEYTNFWYGQGARRFSRSRSILLRPWLFFKAVFAPIFHSLLALPIGMAELLSMRRRCKLIVTSMQRL
jgi:hypothetical protein